MDNVIWVAILGCVATVAASGFTAWAAMRVQIKRFEEAEKDRTQNESKKSNADAAVAAMGAATSAANLNRELSDRINELSDKHEQALTEINKRVDEQRGENDKLRHVFEIEKASMQDRISTLSGENATLRCEIEKRNLEYQEVINELNAWRTRYDNIISRIGQLAEEIQRLEKRARSYELWAKANVDKVRSLGGEPVAFVEVNVVPGVKI